MKNSLLLLFALISFAAFSQTEPGVILKGTKLFSGGFCFDSESDDEKSTGNTSMYKTSNSLIAVYGGYALSDNNVVGLGVSFDANKTQNKSEQTGPFGTFNTDNINKTNTFSIVPFYRRYYFCSPAFALVGTAKLPIGFSNESEQSLVSSSDPSQGTVTVDYPGHTSIGLWIAPSFMWIPSGKWSLEASVGQIGFATSSGSGEVSGQNVDYSSFDFIAKVYLLNPFIAFALYL